ncbi:MAG: SDR family oxidoreductase [Butyrivibrio sp.]|nr:SDR family oxidoreductase [Butyrivibrio sp.]
MNSKKSFLILGASSDIGTALVKELNKKYSESHFCLHYNHGLKGLEDIKPENGNTFEMIQADFTSADDVQKMIAGLKEKEFSPTHIVHLPAAKLVYTRLKDFDLERVQNSAMIQVYSFVEVLKAFLPAMVKRKDHNKVVAVLSSVVGGQPVKSMLEYTMVKSMLYGVVRQLAADNAGNKININAVSPSMVETKLLSDIDSRLVEMAADDSAEKRNATVDDVVPSILFLLSEDSNYINGINLNVSNGNVIL